jgi:hypothetical protein
MTIFKFWLKDKKIYLDNLVLEDITSDFRTSFIDKKTLLLDKFNVYENVYIAVNDTFFKMAKLFNKSIDAMVISEQNKWIIIIPSRSYVFINGQSVEPEQYSITQDETIIRKLLNIQS